MVGVPRSGGCHTCRRSRKKCDEAKPLCMRCTKAGKICEGYARYSTFVNRTGAGVQKKKRFEEVIISNNPVQLEVESESASPETVASDEGYLSSGEEYPYRSIVDEFMRIYFPAAPENRTGCMSIWLWEACSSDNPSKILRSAIFALAGGRVAASRHDGELASFSYQQYGQTLISLNEVLGESKDTPEILTLAAIRIMMIYEIFESTTNSVSAWSSHRNGLAGLTVVRGPERFKTPFEKALLLDIMHVELIAAVARQIGSPFSNPRWKLQTEPHDLFQIEHRFLDLAFELGQVSKKELALEKGEPMNQQETMNVIFKTKEIVAQLDIVIATLEKFKPEDSGFPGKPFWNLETALYCAITLTIQQLALRQHLMHRKRLNDLYTDEEWAARAPHNAARIVEAATYALQTEMGLYSGQRCLLPLRNSVWISPKDTDTYLQAAKLYEALISDRGLKHAQDLNTLIGDYKK